MKKTRFAMSAVLVTALMLLMAMPTAADVDPSTVDVVLAPGESLSLEKTVTTPEIPPVVDIVLLEDETSSFGDDITNLQGGTTASDIYDAIIAESPSAQFAVSGFRDYDQPPHGNPGDWAYRSLSGMSPAKADWLAGIAALTAGGGADIPEAQYDAIVEAANNVAWSAGAQHVLVVTTDAPFHLPGVGKPHTNDEAATLAALGSANIIVIGLKAPGAGGELDALAGATGGSVQALSSDGANIAQAILDGLEELTTDVWWEVDADDGLTVTLDPVVHYGVAGGITVTFTETITVADDPNLQGTCLEATVTFIANHYPEEGVPIGTQTIRVCVPDVAPPLVDCVETVNPHGNRVPPAGSTTLPGPKGGQNEDGFYELNAIDNLDPNPEIFVRDTGSGVVFGPFFSGDKVKYTEDADAIPESKKIGSAGGSNNGKSDAIAAHIIGTGDMEIFAVDASGNTSEAAACLVPPPPK